MRRKKKLKANFRSIFFRGHDRFAQVDGLRAIAILWTFAFHVVLLFAEFMSPAETEALFDRANLQWMLHGHFGVDIFFIISGFLIGDLLIAEVERTHSMRFLRFYVRRTIRLAPLYYLIIAIVFVFGLVSGDPKLQISQAWANLIYVNNFIPDLEQFMPWTWSLAVEEQFYLLCPLLILLLYKWKVNPLWAVSLLIAAGFLVNILLGLSAGGSFYFIIHPLLNPADTTEFSKYYDLLYDKLYTRYAALLMGVLIAYLIRRPGFMKWVSANAMSIVLFVAAWAMMYAVLEGIDYSDWRTPIGNTFMATYRYWFAIGIALLLLLTFSSSTIGTWLTRFLAMKFWYPIAQTSYSCYLIQPLVVFSVIKGWYHGQAVGFGDIMLVSAICAAIIFPITILLYAFVEKPLMDLRPK